MLVPGLILQKKRGSLIHIFEEIRPGYETALYQQVISMLGISGKMLSGLGIGKLIAYFLGISTTFTKNSYALNPSFIPQNSPLKNFICPDISKHSTGEQRSHKSNTSEKAENIQFVGIADGTAVVIREKDSQIPNVMQGIVPIKRPDQFEKLLTQLRPGSVIRFSIIEDKQQIILTEDRILVFDDALNQKVQVFYNGATFQKNDNVITVFYEKNKLNVWNGNCFHHPYDWFAWL